MSPRDMLERLRHELGTMGLASLAVLAASFVFAFSVLQPLEARSRDLERALAADSKIALDSALDQFESRTGFLAARGVDVARIKFSTAFGRGFDYYTGFVFELHEASGANGPLIAGGRYDGLLARLGAKTPIPAVGFAVCVERLAAFKGGA